MLDLFIIALLQFTTLTGDASANKIGAAGWENDYAPTTNKIGAAGWENDYAPTTNKIGAAGWEND
ncbi:hypothetical protein [Hymenobacter bucti]|uniref:Uncharacterized protein n=1 Tax=Hymenobacter bucti TaxID=1844114 RepID=A0ABW4QVA5_9BACT